MNKSNTPMKKKEEHDCNLWLDKAVRVGRAQYQCKYCNKDVSVAYYYFQEALNKK